MSLVLGLDSSTQSLSAVILDTEKGIVMANHSVNFGEDLSHYSQPHGYDETGERGEVHSNPLMWLEALDLLLTQLAEGNIDFSKIEAVSGSGQQHGSVYLKANFNDVLEGLTAQSDLKTQLANCLSRFSSPIWMDSSTSEECAEIAQAVGGNEVVCSKSGSVAVERFTGPQIRKFAETDPDSYAETGTIHLVSSFFASILAGKTVAIDHGDGGGMNLMNLSNLDWDQDLLDATAIGLAGKLPPCAPSNSKSGPISHYFVKKYGFSPTCETIIWSGDNPCSLIGMGAASPGKVVISLGTSDTLFAAMPAPKTDPNGFGHVFGNPAGGYMSLICFKNGSLAREAIKEKYELNWNSFEKDALSQTPAGNNDLMMLPFYEPEITPAIDTEGPVFSSDHHYSSGEAVRAVLESQFLNMRAHSDWLGVSPSRIYLTGGASENDGIAQVVANVFGVPVDRLDVPSSATIGAGMRAAHGLGEDLDDLESKFSKPKEGLTVEPDPTACDIYNEFLPKFKAFLAEQFTS
ncbi:MAG: FGGY family carbohydrate kinase [Akkermansiaceae bacterium]|nr:FGGY family carbohydrate kinase [Akkermansiaceae bacterium]